MVKVTRNQVSDAMTVVDLEGLNLFRMGLLEVAHGSGQRTLPLPKIYHTYIFPAKLANFAISRNADIDCTLVHNF